MAASARPAADEPDEVEETEDVPDDLDDPVDSVGCDAADDLSDVDGDELVDDGVVAGPDGLLLDDPAPEDVQALSAPPASATMRQAPTVVRLTPPIGEVSPVP